MKADSPGRAARTVFAFFGHPGAGKSTLCRRFGELAGVPALDTDAFMTPEEVAAVEAGRYTPAMRLRNIERYASEVRALLRDHHAVAIADGLPNDEARRSVAGLLPGARLVFILVQAPRDVWEKRLAAREGSPVSIGVAAADAYVREHWHDPPPAFGHEIVVNGDDPAAVEAALLALVRRFVTKL